MGTTVRRADDIVIQGFVKFLAFCPRSICNLFKNYIRTSTSKTGLLRENVSIIMTLHIFHDKQVSDIAVYVEM